MTRIWFLSKTKERRRRKESYLEAVSKHKWKTTLTMQSWMVATPKTMMTSCDSGSIAVALTPSHPSEMQLYLLMLSSAILESLNYLLPPSFLLQWPEGLYQGASGFTISYVHTYGIAFFLSRLASTHTHTHISDGWPRFSEENIVTAVILSFVGLIFFFFFINVAPIKIT